VDGFEGRVTDIKARYTVIRSLAGRESIVPNELIITNRVENLSLADSRVWISTVVSVGYDSDVDVVMRASRELRAGTIWVNTPMVRELRAPFGGYKQSGIGRDGATSSVEFFTEQKTRRSPSARSRQGSGSAPGAICAKPGAGRPKALHSAPTPAQEDDRG
jgi:small-conductance mechanosensitive channel